MVIYKQGDLFQAPEDVLAHGVNCMEGFGSGVAAGMSKYYPEAKEFYLQKFKEEGWTLGEVQVVHSGKKIIANCATQIHYLPRGVCHADYFGIDWAMNKLKNYAKLYGKTIAAPKIGAGLAGGDWDTISKILDKVFSDYDISVYTL